MANQAMDGPINRTLSALSHDAEFGRMIATLGLQPLAAVGRGTEAFAQLCAGYPLVPVLGNGPDWDLLAALDTLQDNLLQAPARMHSVRMQQIVVCISDHTTTDHMWFSWSPELH